jgi:hypothetical protein
MNKKELLDKVDRAMTLEDQSLMIYAKHVETVLQWSGLDEATRKQIIEHTRTMTADIKNHRQMLMIIKKLLSEE